MKSKVDLLLGTNLGNKDENLQKAKKFIEKEIGLINKESIIMETKPIGFTSDDNFFNQIIFVETGLSPVNLLKKAKEIEKKMGRVYCTPKNGENFTSRIIDIDILKYDELKFSSSILTIPHPQIKTRPFVKKIYKKSNFS